MTEWKTVRGSQEIEPQQIDTTSSSFYVYERKNIRQEEFYDEMSNQTYTQWVYEERKYTKQEYEELNSATTQILMQNISDMAVEIALLKEGNK